MNSQIIYTFETSQPLTAAQLMHLNKCLYDLPYVDEENFSDIPEYVTDIVTK